MATLIDTPQGVGGKINRNLSTTDQKLQTAALQNGLTYTPSTTPPAPTTLNSTTLAPTQSIQVTQPQPSTAADGFSAQVGASADNYFKNYDAQVAQDSQSLAPLQRQIMQAIASPGQAGLTDQAYKSGGVDQAQADLRDINQQILESQRAQKAELESLGKNGALTPAQINAQRDAINRKYISEQADLSVIQLAKQGKFDSAKQIADRAVTAMLEGQKNKLDALQFTYAANKDLFDKKEQRAFELAQADRQRAYANEDYQLRAQFDAKIKQNDPLYQAQLAKAQADARTASSGGGYNGDFAATIDNVANLETTVAGKNQVAANLQSFIAAGDFKSAYNQIANSVEQGLVGEAKQRFANSRTDAEVMQGMKTAIQQYAAAGGDTDLLKGTAESIYNKLGAVNDPKFKTLAVQLQREFQTYRNTMTGAAFSPQESAEYQKVNPTGNNTLDLNLSVIDGALAQLNNRVDSTIKSRAGEGAVYIKEYAQGATPAAATAPLPVGATGTLSSGLKWTIAQ